MYRVLNRPFSSHNRGVSEIQAAKTRGYTTGTGDRVRGKGHSILGGITGSRRRQARGNAMGNKGSFKVRSFL